MKYFYRWMCSTSAKDIGVLYIIIGLFSGIVGTIVSMIIRMELTGDRKSVV